MQGAHGVWELSVNKLHHADMVEDLLEALVAQLPNADLQVRWLVASATARQFTPLLMQFE